MQTQLSPIAPMSKSGDVIAIIHAKNEYDFQMARERLYEALIKKPHYEKLILDRVQ